MVEVNKGDTKSQINNKTHRPGVRVGPWALCPRDGNRPKGKVRGDLVLLSRSREPFALLACPPSSILPFCICQLGVDCTRHRNLHLHPHLSLSKVSILLRLIPHCRLSFLSSLVLSPPPTTSKSIESPPDRREKFSVVLYLFHSVLPLTLHPYSSLSRVTFLTRRSIRRSTAEPQCPNTCVCPFLHHQGYAACHLSFTTSRFS